MQENKDARQEKPEKEGSRWPIVEHALASEILTRREEASKAKNFAIICLTVGIVVIGVGMAAINYMNDRDWRELFASYDYVSQDGNGYNYYNADIEGDVNNGPENQEKEEQEKIQGD